MAKQKFTTTIDSELLEKIKIQAIKEKRSVSDLLEELITNRRLFYLIISSIFFLILLGIPITVISVSSAKI